MAISSKKRESERVEGAANPDIKHTPGAEIPATGKVEQLSRRLLADAPVVREVFGGGSRALPLLAIGLVGIGAFLIWRNFSSKDFSSDIELESDRFRLDEAV